jgi:hypothetical protein
VLAAVTVGVMALAAVSLFSVGDDDAAAPATTTTTNSRRSDRPKRKATTTTGAAPTTSPPVTVPGAVPADGALLDQPPGDLPTTPGCEAPGCLAAEGSGGAFHVAAVQVPDGTRSVRLYRADGAPVARTPDFPPDVEVFGIALLEGEVDGEPVVVVDYDFNGSGSVHSFDVVAWDEAAPQPRVVTFVGGSGQDRANQRDGALEFVSANYDDGAPTCCPNQADVRTLTRPGPGEWTVASETVPMGDAP